MCRFVPIVVSAFLLWDPASGAEFQNLGFDSANTNNPVSVGPNYLWGKTEDFLPGWQLLLGETPVPFVGLNATPLALNAAVLFDTRIYDQGLFIPIEGKYSLSLACDGVLTYQLRQTAELPSNAQSIHFVSALDHLHLTLDGRDVPLTYVPRALDPIEGSDVYGDISAFAGRTAELSFSSLQTGRPAAFVLDSITFMVPEPAPWVLLALATLMLACFPCRRSEK
jgi:hypothetical protein